MVVVDSSVWIEFFRGRNPELTEALRQLLDADEVALAAPVRLELLSGASKRDFGRLARLLSALPLLVPEQTLWKKLEGWAARARERGERFGALDLLIAGIADDHGAFVWSRDADFVRLARLGFVKLTDGR
jgi:predicted nucleic acid-binding protein